MSNYIHQPGVGDQLAAGGSKASYRVPQSYVNTEAAEDFRNLSEGEFRSKYLVSAEEYANLTDEKLATLIKFNKTVAVEEDPKELKVEDKRQDLSDEAIAKRQQEAFAERQKQLAERKAAIEQEFAAAVAMGAKAKPVGDKVLVWRIPEQDSLLYDTDMSARKPLVCVVLNVSDRPSDEYAAAALSTLNVGDTVVILSQTGTEVTVEGVNAVVLHVYDILLRL